MPRPPRLLLSHSYYHVMTRGNNKNIVFKDEDDFYYYLSLIKRYKVVHPFDLYHYCLMPNHTHFLIKTKKAADFSVFMKKINLAYFHYYRRRYGWVGHFWQDRFKTQPVGKDDYFIQCGKYIELNPVRGNLVERPDSYLFSSFTYYSKGDINPLLTEDIFYEDLGKTKTERQKAYTKMIIDEAIENSYRKKIWGSSSQRHNEARKIEYHKS